VHLHAVNETTGVKDGRDQSEREDCLSGSWRECRVSWFGRGMTAAAAVDCGGGGGSVAGSAGVGRKTAGWVI